MTVQGQTPGRCRTRWYRVCPDLMSSHYAADPGFLTFLPSLEPFNDESPFPKVSKTYGNGPFGDREEDVKKEPRLPYNFPQEKSHN